jgi:hypothetical protein
MMVVRAHCHGYANGCECRMCAARHEGIERGVLFYDGQGRLRHKGRDQAVNQQAIVAYMRDQERETLRRAA